MSDDETSMLWLDPKEWARRALLEREPGDAKGRSATYLAAKLGLVAFLEFFLPAWSVADVSKGFGKHRGTPLHAACKHGHLDCVRALLARACPPHLIADADGKTPGDLVPADCGSRAEILAALDAYGASLDVQMETPRWKAGRQFCSEKLSCCIDRVQACPSLHHDQIYLCNCRIERTDMGVNVNGEPAVPVRAKPLRMAEPACTEGGQLSPLISCYPALVESTAPPPSSSTSLLNLPDNSLVKIFSLCRRFCPCGHHAHVIRVAKQLRNTYLASPGYPTTQTRWSMYDTVYTLCTLEMVCKRFCLPDSSGKSLPEQTAEGICREIGIVKLSMGKNWKQELMLSDIVALEIDLRVRVDLHTQAYEHKNSTAHKEIIKRWGKPDPILAGKKGRDAINSCFSQDTLALTPSGWK
ncbi:hypothetical protein Pelo_3547 [Pelomyxa schiedti]|nr:hypothetical protein Pelo_3547 [Pelomyxa schiedti]